MKKPELKIVLGEGPIPAKIMIIGEAPGTNELITGRPFTGSAGKTLDNWLNMMNIDRSKIYITNTIKQKLPNNRAPTKKEITENTNQLMIEINKVNPTVIITLGKTPLSVLMPHVELLETVHGGMHTMTVQGKFTMLIPLYHPSYINRMGRDKKEIVEKALQNIKNTIDLKRLGVLKNG